MALQIPGYTVLPVSRSSLDGVMEAFDLGRQQRRDEQALDAAARAFGAGGGGQVVPAQQPSALERLAGFAGSSQPLPSGLPATTMRMGPTDIVTQSHAAAANAADPALTDYFANARKAESGGNDLAANPNSSALGRYQFLEGTWRGLMEQYPELGLTPDGRTDPAQQERAMERFTQDNARVLAGAGIPVNPGTLYAAHFLGAGGASNVLRQDPNSPISAYLEPGVIQANPHLNGMTVGDFAAWANEKGGNGSGGYRPPLRNEGQVPGARQFTPDPDTLRALLASDTTRDLAVSLITAQQNADASQGRFVIEEGGDGSVWQRDTLTGEREILREAPAPAPQGARPLTAEERAAWGIPETDTRPYSIVPGKAPEPVGTGGQTINVNSPGSGDGAFFEQLDAADGKVFADLIAEAPTIGRRAVQIDQLEGLLNNMDSGGMAGVQQMLGEFGIATEGLDTIQAVQALINQIVPEQRQPGSGPMSDADLALFKQSVPRVINQPGGNQIIIDTMRGINEYTRMQADIAARLASRQISRDEARAELASLPNPLEGYAERVRGSQTGGIARPTTDEEYNALPSGALFIDPDDGQTYRKP